MQVYKAIKYIRLSYTDDKTVESDSVANLVLVYKCGQEKSNNLYYQMKEQRRCSTWQKTKNLIPRNLSSKL